MYQTRGYIGTSQGATSGMWGHMAGEGAKALGCNTGHHILRLHVSPGTSVHSCTAHRSSCLWHTGLQEGSCSSVLQMGTAQILLYAGRHTLREQGWVLISRPVPALVTTVLDLHTHSSSMAKGWQRHPSSSPDHPSVEMQELNFLPANTRQSQSLVKLIMFSQREIQIYLIAVSSLQGSLLVLSLQDNWWEKCSPGSAPQNMEAQICLNPITCLTQCLPAHCCQHWDANLNHNRQVFSRGISVILLCLPRLGVFTQPSVC